MKKRSKVILVQSAVVIIKGESHLQMKQNLNSVLMMRMTYSWMLEMKSLCKVNSWLRQLKCSFRMCLRKD